MDASSCHAMVSTNKQMVEANWHRLELRRGLAFLGIY